MSEQMIRFVAGRGSAHGLAQTLNSVFGYQATAEDTECLISQDDPMLKRGPKKTLDLGPEMNLVGKPIEDIADQLLPKKASFLEKYEADVPSRINFLGGFGLASELERAVTAVEVVPSSQLRKVLVDHLLPLIVTELKATHCCTVVMDSEEQQRRLSFSKIAILTQRYGIDRASQLVQGGKVLSRIVPDPLSALNYIGAFIVFSPWALALPVGRRDRIWIFYKNDPWVFGKGASVSFLEQFQTNLSPRSTTAYTVLMKELAEIPLHDRWSYLRLAVHAINNLLSFVNDPRTFVGEDGVVDVLRQVQAMSALNLLFADVRAISTSPQSHSRTTFAFAAIDKLANLQRHISCSTANEVELAKALVSLIQRRAVRDSFKAEAARSAESVPKKLIASTRAFLVIHRNLRQQLGTDGQKEAYRLKALRTLRNLHHGAFLDRAAFENLFLEHEGTVPEEIGSLPFLLCFSAGLDPEHFFEVGS